VARLVVPGICNDRADAALAIFGLAADKTLYMRIYPDALTIFRQRGLAGAPPNGD
jgi:hypothetical protein